VQPVSSHVGAPVVRVRRLGHHEGPALGADGQAAGATAAVGGGGQGVADEAAGGTAELEDAVGVGVCDENVARLTVNGHAVRTLELTLTERVTCAQSKTEQVPIFRRKLISH